MRKPNGYGAVFKLSGNRRKPYAVRITTGWTVEGKQITKYIGYYSNRKEAEMALAEYNRNPYVISEDVTVEELYNRFVESKVGNVSEGTLRSYRFSFNVLGDILDVPVSKLNLGALQSLVDASDKNKPTLVQAKSLLGGMFDFAILHELLPPERKAIITHLDLSKKGNPNSLQRTIFSQEEMDKLWEIDARLVLILIYTGVRIGELLNLTADDVHISDQYFDITSSKTKAGIRQVPIADKILPFFESFPYGVYDYNQFRKKQWLPVLNALGVDHTPHDTRHTFISLMTAREIDPRVIKAIVGHSGSGVTEAVYTHIPMRKLIAAVNTL